MSDTTDLARELTEAIWKEACQGGCNYDITVEVWVPIISAALQRERDEADKRADDAWDKVAEAERSNAINHARAEAAEASLHLAQLEIAARKQECQTVTRKRDSAEARVKELEDTRTNLVNAYAENILEMHVRHEATERAMREALIRAEKDLDELAGIQEGHYDFEGIRNYALISRNQARATLQGQGGEDS